MMNEDLPSVVKHLQFDEDIFEPDLDKVSGGTVVLTLEYIYVAPMLQNKSFGVEQEENFIQELLEYFDKSEIELEQVYFASAYFNPPFAIWDKLTRINSKKFEFVTATKEVLSL